MRNYRDLDVWTKSHEITLEIYQLLADFPKFEQYALTDQIRRAAVSIPSNIAEGSAKNSDKEFARYLKLARGSANELHYQLYLAEDLGYIDTNSASNTMNELEEVKRMLTGFIQSLT